MLVKELMRQAYVISKDVGLDEAAKIMSDRDTDSIIYVVNDKVQGLISEKDLVKNFHSKKSVIEIMSKNIISIDPESTIDDALELMRDHKIKRLPVVEDGRLKGIISVTDIAANADELEGDFFFA